jgi:hypothetical protein
MKMATDNVIIKKNNTWFLKLRLMLIKLLWFLFGSVSQKINANNTWSFALIDYFHDMSLLRNPEAEGGINFQKVSTDFRIFFFFLFSAWGSNCVFGS